MDAIGTKRFDSQTGADREVQRVLMELLTQMDGFDQHTNVKVIMATNRHDTLDPALMRPGRLDRKIEFPPPDRRQKRLIFQACTQKMNLGDDVDLEDFVARPEKISAADIASICSEAGLQAVRNNRYVVLAKDFQSSLLGVAECLAHNKPPFTHESYAHTHTHARTQRPTERQQSDRTWSTYFIKCRAVINLIFLFFQTTEKEKSPLPREKMIALSPPGAAAPCRMPGEGVNTPLLQAVPALASSTVTEEGGSTVGRVRVALPPTGTEAL